MTLGRPRNVTAGRRARSFRQGVRTSLKIHRFTCSAIPGTLHLTNNHRICMAKKSKPSADRRPSVPVEMIERRIYLIRGQKVMLSTHLAELYQVEARALVQAVKRNIERFPEDFMFQLTRAEFNDLKSQFVTSSGAVSAEQFPTLSPKKAWPCSPASSEARVPFRSTSPSCEHLSACERCSPATKFWLASWSHGKQVHIRSHG